MYCIVTVVRFVIILIKFYVCTVALDNSCVRPTYVNTMCGNFTGTERSGCPKHTAIE